MSTFTSALFMFIFVIGAATAQRAESWVAEGTPDSIAPSEGPGGDVVAIHPYNLSIIAGDDFTLWCQVSGVLPLEIKWYLGAEEIPVDDSDMDSRASIKSNKTGSRLTILSASEADAGLYKCQVTDNGGQSLEATSAVNVQEPVSHVFRCPEESQGFCHNAGTCIYMRGNQQDLFCACLDGYTGKQCQHQDLGYDLDDLFAPSTAAADMKAPLFGAALGVVMVVIIAALCIVRHYRNKYLNELHKNQARDLEDGKECEEVFSDEENHNVETIPLKNKDDANKHCNGSGQPPSA